MNMVLLPLKDRVYKATDTPTLLNRVTAWSTRKSKVKRLNTYAMKEFRCMSGMKREDKIRSAYVGNSIKVASVGEKFVESWLR